MVGRESKHENAETVEYRAGDGSIYIKVSVGMVILDGAMSGHT